MKHLTTGLALAALALGLTTARASAEPVLKGTFDLPTAAYWGETLLQPGQYSISMSTDAATTLPIFHVAGEGLTKTFLAIATPEVESKRNILEIANVDGTYVVQSFDAGVIGESFAFGVTKAVKAKALRASVEPIPVSVPVLAVAGQ